MRASRWCVLLIAAVGCNQVFDIGETRPAADVFDLDGDGVEDADDNCIDIPNPDQANDDADDVGNACDLCPQVASANQHDEDHDQIGDVCDPCPNMRDFGGDEDGDGVGDLCDTALSVRRLFDPFVALGPQFVPGNVPWAANNDEVAPVSTLDSGDAGLRVPSVSLAGSTYVLRVLTRSDRRWTTDELFGVRMLRTDVGGTWAACVMTCTDDTTCTLTAVAGGSIQSTMTKPSATPTLAMRVGASFSSATSQTVFSCLVPGAQTLKIIVSGSPVEVTPALLGSPNVHLTSVDIVQ